jgi:uncharacterized protein YutE (UPF0331/DUF86 family)
MTYLVERLSELRRHLDHLQQLRPRVTRQALVDDLSLHNDVLYSLLTVCQLVIDIAGELSARRQEAFEDYTQAVRNLSHDPRFSTTLVERLAQLPGFRNVVIHEYMQIDFDRVVEAVNNLGAIEEFIAILRSIAVDT